MLRNLGDAVALSTVLVGVSAVLTWAELAVLELESSVVGSPPGRRRHVAYAALVSLAGVVAIVGATASWRAASLGVIAAAALRSARNDGPLRDGADDMLEVTAVGVTLAALPLANWARLAALGFVAAQLMLAYIVAGAAKLCSQAWRDGTAVVDVLATRDFGRVVPAPLRAPGNAGRLAAWTTIAVELFLPVLFALGGPALIAGVALGVTFHAVIAVMLGLNRFVPCFLASYPAAVLVSTRLALLH